MQLTELDKDLLRIAASDPQKFIRMIGEKNWIDAKACLLRQAKNSYGKISIKLNITERQVWYACKQCDEPTTNG